MGQGVKPPVPLLQSHVGMQGICAEEGTKAVENEEQRFPAEGGAPAEWMWKGRGGRP